MLSIKELVLRQTREAFDGDNGMSLKAVLAQITQAEASWTPHPDVPTVEQLVRHAAWNKAIYCERGFGRPMLAIDEQAHNLPEALELFEQSHRILTECLQGLTDEALVGPIPTPAHGETAANFFWIMLMHDLYHAGQIRTRRTLYRAVRASGV